MDYIENIFVCMAGPLIIAAICMGKKYFRIFFFIFAGMGACLLSAYINTFMSALFQITDFHASVKIAPVVEEIMKFLPLFFYIFVFEPETEAMKQGGFIITAGFATFENICYLVQNGAGDFSFLLIRGFGTGAMHILCGAIAAYGLGYVWKKAWVKGGGTLGLLAVCIGFHGVYNLLICCGGKIQYVAYMLPVFTVIIGIFARKRLVFCLVKKVEGFLTRS